MNIMLILYGGFVMALTTAEYRGDIRAQYMFKPAAALGFILIALMSGALESRYGLLILSGLVACAVGDVLLLKRGAGKTFLLGMGAFAAGHVLYIISFMVFGLTPRLDTFTAPDYIFLISAGLILLVFNPIAIIRTADKRMKTPIVIYTAIILAMCGLSIFTWTPIIIIAALLFAVSDHFVGKDRFVKHKRGYALAITPLYFGAQVLFALSVAQPYRLNICVIGA